MAALRSANVGTVRGPAKFDDLGNVVGNVYLRKVTRKDGRLVNSVFKTYPDVQSILDLRQGSLPCQPSLFARISPGQISRAVKLASSTATADWSRRLMAVSRKVTSLPQNLTTP